MRNLLFTLILIPLITFGQTEDPCYSVDEVFTLIEYENPAIEINLLSGWNMIGYPCSHPIDLVEAFSYIVNNLIIVKNNNGDVYLPEWEFNGIGFLIPGEGYQVKMSNSEYGFSFCESINWPYLEGCTDCEASNFNRWAIVDDGSCGYFFLGCTEAWASNYDTLATIDDGSCERYGCTSDWADNYDDLATSDDGSCLRLGCTFSLANNYDYMATFDDGSCYLDMFWGCTEPDACNFNENVFNDDGSCEFTWDYGCCAICSGELGETNGYDGTGFIIEMDWDCDGICDWDEVYGCGDPLALNFEPFTTEDDGSCFYEIFGCMDTIAFNFNSAASQDNGTCEYFGCTDSTACNFSEDAINDYGTCQYSQFGYDCNGYLLEACPYDIYVEYSADAQSYNADLCQTLIVYGCTDFIAENYNTLANTDDGSCDYILGCMDSIADNFNENATQDDNSCIYLGCMDETADNYNPQANQEDGTCIYFGCMNYTADNYDSQANYDDGGCVIYGCTLDGFPNYNSEATIDDLSCDMSSTDVYGCTDSTALNYNNPPLNTIDNGTCGLIQLGDIFGGGVVLYIGESGRNGLVASIENVEGGYTSIDLPNLYGFEWGCSEEFVDGADGASIGTGYQNTLDIVNQGCTTVNGGITAAQAALDYESGGYNDWFLPSIDELSIMHSNYLNVFGFDTLNMFSLTENWLGDITASNCAYFSSSSEWSFNSMMRLSVCESGQYPSIDNRVKTNPYITKPVRKIGFWLEGCMDADYAEYNADANVDDGSCASLNCDATLFSISMVDSYGDGWNGNVLTIGENSFTIESGAEATAAVCLEDGVYTVTNGGGSYASEVSWSIGDALSGGSPFEGELIVGDVAGCTDAAALNFNANATSDDGSCVLSEACPYDVYVEYSVYALNYNVDLCQTLIVLGCTIDYALNYDSLANTNDGSCQYLGCMDSTAFNYNEIATVDDGACIYYGCIDSIADNYDSTANTDDGTCIYLGCIDEVADNYDSQANTDDSTCIYLGCMDETADNYNPQANQEDGTCIYFGCMNPTADNYDAQANEDDGSCIIYGCTLVDFPNYNSEATAEDNSCDMSSADVFGCTDPSYLEYDPIINHDNGTCSVLVVYGCTGPDHCNYNPEANTDDGSCIYPEPGYDCEGNFTPYIGMEAEGGIVFYVDETGQHGLVAALEDLGQFEWGCHGTDLNGDNSSLSPELQAIGTGLQNTLDIVSGCSETPIAASEALAYESEGYSDWYLPSRYELVEMYNTIGNGGPDGNIGGFENNWYWSSSEYNDYGAWYVNFNNGYTTSSIKNDPNRVRVIRAF